VMDRNDRLACPAANHEVRTCLPKLGATPIAQDPAKGPRSHDERSLGAISVKLT